MKIYEKQSWHLPVEDFKANTFYTIYSSKNSKMVRIHLNNPRYEGKKDEGVIIPSHIDYFNDGDDYSIDLEQGPTPSLKIQYWRKENGENVDHKELTINAKYGIVFTEEIKGVEGYTFASYDKGKENIEEDISTIEKQLDSDKVISTMIEYYGKYHNGLLETVKEVKGKSKSLNDKRTTPTE